MCEEVTGFKKAKFSQTRLNQERFVTTAQGNLTKLHMGGAAGSHCVSPQTCGSAHGPLSTLQTGVLCKAPGLPREALGHYEAIPDISPYRAISYNFLLTRLGSKFLGKRIGLTQHEEVSSRVGGVFLMFYSHL